MLGLGFGLGYGLGLGYVLDCRYDGQIAVFGAGFQEKLSHQHYLLVSYVVRLGVCGRARPGPLAKVAPAGRWVLALSAASCSKALP